MKKKIFAAALFLILSGQKGAAQGASGQSGDEKAAQAQARAAIEQNITLSAAKRAQLEAEVKALGADEKALSRALAGAAAGVRALDKSLHKGAAKLADLEQSQAAQSRLLAARRAEMAEILAALERLGYNPPPAVLAQSNDAAKALRASVLLAALLPQMQEKTQQVQAEISRLAALQEHIITEQDKLKQVKLEHKEEEWKLKLLLAEKTQTARQKQRNLAEEEANRRDLEAKAQSLQDLLGNLSRTPPQAYEADRLLPAVKFSALRGRLTVPAEGRLIRRFGQITDGKPALGESFAVAPGTPILAPAESVVRYAGLFRSYGRVLILDAGENYYIILAGLGAVYTAPGRSVLQGEPVGAMEAALPANKGGYSLGKTAPKLYIELRKDGRPINPALWWAAGAPS